MKKVVKITTLCLFLFSLNSCILAAVAGVGAAGGYYYAKDK